MRPRSIVLFDWLYLGSLLGSLLAVPRAYSKATQSRTSDAALAQMGTSFGTVLITVMAVAFGISLLLWFLVSRRASNGAKWILVVLTAIGAIGLIPSIRQPTADPTQSAIAIIMTALQVIAVVFLFRRDARDWFAGKRAVDPDVFR